jgi:hypothetical protein
MIRRIVVVAMVAALMAGTAYITSWWVRGPEQYCSTEPVAEFWSQDRAYKATLLVKNCNLWESIFYRVRIDAMSPPLKHGWFMYVDLNDDERPDASPSVRWDGPRLLSIEVQTRTLRGSILQNVGEDLSTSVTYIAKAPAAFPNYSGP